MTCVRTFLQPMPVSVLLVLVLLESWPQPAGAHVSLSFPPARRYQLDYLDSVNSKPPCGMPRGDVRTSVASGSTFTVAWSLSYPHQGGYRLEILDAEDKVVLGLTDRPNNKGFNPRDSTAQNQTVSLPEDFVCYNCTMRLLREVLEWPGEERMFWSCADLDVVPASDYKEDCNGHGRASFGRCRCEKTHFGDKCQFTNECRQDRDCGKYGKCVNIDGTSYPKQLCFCRIGYFGNRCSQKNPAGLNGPVSNLDLYRRLELSPEYTLYWRVLPDLRQLEVVAQVRGTSYVALGWRPTSLTPSCKKFPVIADPTPPPTEPPKQAEPEANRTEPAGESGAEARGNATGGETGPAQLAQKPDIVLLPQDTEAPQSDPTATGGPYNGSRRKRQTEASPASDGGSTSPTESSTDSTSDVNELPPAGNQGKPAGNQRVTGAGAKVQSNGSAPGNHTEQTGQITAAGNQTDLGKQRKAEAAPVLYPRTGYYPGGEFHPMDCTDMVIGRARGDFGRVEDLYSRDRSTPQPDQFWGGNNSLTAALAYERDGITTVLFRRPLDATELTDHTIESGPMHVIWARGQQSGNYQHSPDSGLEAGTASVPNFYRPDELKYHGHGEQRGVTELDFLERGGDGGGQQLSPQAYDFCGAEWRWPPDCAMEAGDCEYAARWELLEGGELVRFTVQSAYTDRWTGIGFSRKPNMPRSDAVLGYVVGTGRPVIQDVRLSGYLPPVKDSRQDTSNHTGELRDGQQQFSFVRPRKSPDKTDASFTDDECFYMLFPIKGGSFLLGSKRFGKHDKTPIVSAEKICIKSCANAGPRLGKDGKPLPPPPPPNVEYEVLVKLAGVGQVFVVPDPDSEQFQVISERIRRDIQHLLQDVPGLKRVRLTELTDESGELVARLSVMVDRKRLARELQRAAEDPELEPRTVDRLLNQSLPTGLLGKLAVNPLFLQVTLYNDSRPASGSDEESFDLQDPVLSEQAKVYLIVGAVVLLLALALVQLACSTARNKRHKTAANAVNGKQNGKMKPAKRGRRSSGSGWREIAARADLRREPSYRPPVKSQPPPAAAADSPPRQQPRLPDLDLRARLSTRQQRREPGDLPARTAHSLQRPVPPGHLAEVRAAAAAAGRGPQRPAGHGFSLQRPPGHLPAGAELGPAAHSLQRRPAPPGRQPNADFYFMRSQRANTQERAPPEQRRY